MPHPARRTRGAAATETLVVAIPLLLTGLGSLEMARWWHVRQAVAVALTEAARAGSTAGADPGAIAGAMTRGLQPLFATDASAAGLAEGLGRQARAAAPLAAVGLPAWELAVLSPSAAHFADFAEQRPGAPRGLRDTYQAEQHRAHLAAGKPGGRGHASGDDVFAANTLILRATYLHAPLVPGVGALLRGVGRLAPAGLGGSAMRDAGYLPITLELALPMQSPASEAAAGAIIHPGNASLTVPPGSAGSGGSGTGSGLGNGASSPCTGLWCTPRQPNPPILQPGPSPSPAPLQPPSPTPPIPAPGAPDPGPPAPGPEDGCGVILCCT